MVNHRVSGCWNCRNVVNDDVLQCNEKFAVHESADGGVVAAAAVLYLASKTF